MIIYVTYIVYFVIIRIIIPYKQVRYNMNFNDLTHHRFNILYLIISMCRNIKIYFMEGSNQLLTIIMQNIKCIDYNITLLGIGRRYIIIIYFVIPLGYYFFLMHHT